MRVFCIEKGWFSKPFMASIFALFRLVLVSVLLCFLDCTISFRLGQTSFLVRDGVHCN